MHFKINFNHALIISLAWHLLCFFMITVVVVPAGIRQKRLSDIYFLGSLVEKDIVPREYKGMEGITRRRVNVRIEPLFAGSQPVAGLADQARLVDHALRKDYDVSGMKALVETEKILPSLQPESFDKQSIFFDFHIDGQAGKRKILFKPPLPGDINSYLSGQGDNLNSYYNISLDISITGRGEVLSLDIVETSGNTHIDLIMQEYIENWRFSSLEPDQEDDITQGVMSVKLSSQALKN
jgi:hypothetical protein